MSFGHRLIPHHHYQEFSEHYQEKDTDCSNEEKEQTHFEHENHLDEGFLAFLSCVLSKVEHNNHNEFEKPSKVLNSPKKIVFYKALVPTFILNKVAPCSVEVQEKFDRVVSKKVSKVYLSAFQFRGPPNTTTLNYIV